MTGPFTVLAVCSANICRSPATHAILERKIARSSLPMSVASAGSVALPGKPACDLSLAIAGFHEYEHTSQQLTPELVTQADLVLALERSNSASVAQLDPRSRAKTFLLIQAGHVAAIITEALNSGTLPPGAPALPPAPTERLRWLVDEMDAARAQVPPDTNLEVPDPHVLGYEMHPVSGEAIAGAVERIVGASGRVLSFDPETRKIGHET